MLFYSLPTSCPHRLLEEEAIISYALENPDLRHKVNNSYFDLGADSFADEW
ncbi:hypothetical protein MWH25_04830 [Natroniella acetigena]|uniref:hypothetical protein n=1 Tax=Natroniella acetigena TaxID=52004 RepID=UPI00200AF489|nr:hypothetical protein [Natroniella acetigena]MCK8827071.1 hypothetical protein [Natroniella acetigena]